MTVVQPRYIKALKEENAPRYTLWSWRDETMKLFINEYNAALKWAFKWTQYPATWRNKTVKLRKWNFWPGKVESASSSFQNPARELVWFPPTTVTDSSSHPFLNRKNKKQKTNKKKQNTISFFFRQTSGPFILQMPSTSFQKLKLHSCDAIVCPVPQTNNIV